MLNPRGAGGFGKSQMTIFRFISSFGTRLQLSKQLPRENGPHPNRPRELEAIGASTSRHGHSFEL